MQYMGGKSRIARSIAEIINEIPRRKIKNCQTHCSDNHAGCGGGDCFVSLFCGSCAVESKVQGFSRKLLNDRHEYLIAMLQGVQQGYNLPEHITLEQYRYIRENKDADPVLAGFVGFGCSFGGKWFGGYARNKTGTNYAEQSKRSLLKDMATLQDAQFVCGDYRRLCIPPNSVIYADPPYNNTTGYTGDKFDTTEFWIAMRLLADLGHTVFVSEQEAPPDIQCIWEKPFTRTLDRNKGNQWGQRHLRYLKQHRKVLYTNLLTSGKLNSYLADIDKQAEDMFLRLVEQIANREGVTEQLKAENQIEWVGRMNNIRSRAMEIVNAELIYS